MTTIPADEKVRLLAEDARPFVLVVDDDAALRRYACNAMHGCGIDVAEAATGREAIQAISEQEFDCVLLDISMPGLDGFQTCTEVRRRRDNDPLPIVVITGCDDPHSIERAYHSGATDFVTKPINWPILEQRIRHLSLAYRTARHLEHSEDNRRALLEAVPDTVLRTDSTGVLWELKSAHQSTMLDRCLRRYGSLLEALPDTAAKQFRTRLGKLRQSGLQSFSFELVEAGDVRHYEARMIATDNGGCTTIIRDFTEQRRADRRLRQLAFYDELTGLPNAASIQTKLNECVDHATKRKHGVAVLRIAIEDLEHVDGVLGHYVRSELIKQAADRLSNTVSPQMQPFVEDTPIGRLEGGEFVILISPMSDKDDLDRLLETVQACFRRPFSIQDNDISLTANVGVAVFPRDGTQQQLLDRAGSALDDAKRQQGACCRFYSSHFHRRRLKRINLEAQLRKALDRDEFYLEYQPKVAADTRRLVGVEALVRWRNAEIGVIQPDRFIPLAEQTGLIAPLGERVLELACGQARQWHTTGCGKIRVAVNFSGLQFSQWDVSAGIQYAIEKHRIGAAQLEVEITETSVMDARDRVTRVLMDLREMGVRSAIDDFGTGYSSLSLLRGLPFDIIKIDRDFIQHVLTDQRTASITEAIIRMGQAMGMEIVAEGVEEESQMDFLRKRGCDVIQGYLTGRPASADIITEKLLEQNNPDLRQRCSKL